MSTPITPLQIREATLQSFRKAPIVYGTLDKAQVWPLADFRETLIPPLMVVSLNSNTNRYHIVRGTQLSANEAKGQTVLSVTRPSVFKVGDNVWITDHTATEDLGAVTNVGASTITVTNSVKGTADAGFVTGDHIYVAPGTDGYSVGTAVGLMLCEVDTYNAAKVLEHVYGCPILTTHDQGDPFDSTLLTSVRNMNTKALAELTALGFRFIA